MIFISAVTFSVTYTVALEGVAVSSRPTFSTPAATDDNNDISTSKVAENLTADINALPGWTATQSELQKRCKTQ